MMPRSCSLATRRPQADSKRILASDIGGSAVLSGSFKEFKEMLGSAKPLGVTSEQQKGAGLVLIGEGDCHELPGPERPAPG